MIYKQGVVLVVNLKKILANYEYVKTIVGEGVDVFPAVKANAYGIGAYQVIKKLQINTVFVARIEEALQLRKYFAYINIIVLNGVIDTQIDDFIKYRLTPVIISIDQAKLWLKRGNQAGCLLHVDTGINRAGMDMEEFEQNYAWLKKLNIRYVMSHLASLISTHHFFNKQQLEKFLSIKQLTNKPLSLANSLGCFLGKEFYFNMVRPGKALYGLVSQANNFTKDATGLQLALSLFVKVNQVKNLKKGMRVGYGGSFECKKNTKIAILDVGYADFSHWCVQKVYVPGYGYADLIGAVSMDMMAIDVTQVEFDITHMQVEIFGIYTHGLIKTPTNIFSSLGNRVKKIYTE